MNNETSSNMYCHDTFLTHLSLPFQREKNIVLHMKKDIQIGNKPVPYIPHHVICELFV